ncbi:maleylpyruvate isomerase N-terminal domain-containing protein [Kineosporia succinea]|uniref:Uncharacterized protein (TIGR03083 family) n=1 Tax=Kineosporia succinea TaxID=84632 RepID=A0ABT9P891_9ACTN|nr:maleylpyruvate isomerase N-terminal domain-containing protein [Kineosporia succinea]MDP9828922.1 uncharacterized protein (TIGR03083 family) [Kineosporia succinea]
MHTPLPFSELLRLFGERSADFRAAIAAAPDLEVRVPTCPDWTLSDLARHIGERRRCWAATVAAGPDATGLVVPDDIPPMPSDRAELVAWLAEGAQQQIDALAAAGPSAPCWTWWGDSQSPRTSGAVARHQLQEISVHAYDAQLTVGPGKPLPSEVALDGVEEFQFTICANTTPWPHRPAVLDYHATEGSSWRVTLGADGVRADRLDLPASTPDVSVRGTASDLQLFCYGRLELDALQVTGDVTVIDQLVAWDPSA